MAGSAHPTMNNSSLIFRSIRSCLALLVTVGLGTGCGDDTEVEGGGGSGGSSDDSGARGGGGAEEGGGGSGGGAGGGAPAGKLVLLDQGLAVDLTPDGDIAVVQSLESIEGEVYTYDVATETSALATTLGDATVNLATGVAQTGRFTAFYGVPVVAGVFNGADGWQDIDSPFAEGCDVQVAGAWDISADGAVVVGFAWNGCAPQAFRWTDDGETGTLLLLDLLGEGSGKNLPTNRATVVSDDGTVAAGFAQNGAVDRSPAVWNADGSGFMLDPDDMDAPGEVLSISADGSVMAGIWALNAFSWTEEGGRVELGQLPTSLPGEPCWPNAMSADGTLIFGGCGDPFSGIPAAFVWTEEHGMRSLADIAAEHGITVPDGFRLSSVIAASADGSVLLGVANDDLFNQKSFVLELPVSAY